MEILDFYTMLTAAIAVQPFWIKVLPGSVAIVFGLLLIGFVEGGKPHNT